MRGERDDWDNAVATKMITLELPDDLLELLGPPVAIAGKVRETLVLDLLRNAQITQGVAARLLGVTRYDILDLMVLHCIPSGPLTASVTTPTARDA